MTWNRRKPFIKDVLIESNLIHGIMPDKLHQNCIFLSIYLIILMLPFNWRDNTLLCV